MSSKERFSEALKLICERLKSVVENGNEIAIITHIDADGIASGSIMALALARMNARYSVRAISDMTGTAIEGMKAENKDFYLILDLGGGWASQLRKALGSKWAIIDHHQIPEEEVLTDDSGQILNAWIYEIDGGKDISAGGMAYMVASALDRDNRDLSKMAIVSAVADRQDQGEKRSFTGVNSEILKVSESLGLVSVDLDLLLTGRETKPLHEALAFTSFPYMDGLTWNRDACYALLKNAGLKLKENGRWRVLAEFSQEEKSAILSEIAKFLAISAKTETRVIDDIIGYVYTLVGEDSRSQLRDAREFATLLNACGRGGKMGVGIGVCLGDRNDMLTVAEDILSSYRSTLRNYLSTIFADKWRVMDDGRNIFVNGEGLVAEDMVGAVSSLLSTSPSLGERLIFVRTLAQDGSYKFSSRKSVAEKSHANLGVIMRHCAEALGGAGGGHSAAAGCRIPSQSLDDFIAKVKVAASDPKFATTS